MSGKKCINCNSDTDEFRNYCNWGCQLENAKRLGGKVIAPNGLPITCVLADGTMLEHAEADHPNYRFPIEVECINPSISLPDWDPSFNNQSHALIYADDAVAVSLYECQYFMWSLNDGRCMVRLADEEDWRLTNDSISKIKKHKAKSVVTGNLFSQLNELRSLLEKGFSSKTTNPNYNLMDPLSSAGQCVPVAIIVQKQFGGKFISTKFGDQSHWFNRICYLDRWWEIDLTGDQYGYQPVQASPFPLYETETRVRHLD